MAFGGKGIQWFCYFTPPPTDENFGEGCIARNGEPTQTYYYVQEANRQIRALQDTYMNFEWKGFMTKIGTENTDGSNNNFDYINSYSLDEHARISKLSAQQDTLVGVFKDEEERDGFMFVNFTEPTAEKEDKVSVDFKDATGALMYVKGERQVVGLNNGRLEFTMEAGDGVFVVPLK